MAKILVTGGAGFIGSHLCERLLSEGHQVILLDDLSTGSRSNIAHLARHSRFLCHFNSLLNRSLTCDLIRQSDQVYHLASAVGVELVVSRPVHAIEATFAPTDIVIRACAEHEKPLLITSTSEVYGKGTSVPLSEQSDTLSGPTSCRRWSYAYAKALDECLALAHWFESGLPVCIARLFNTVGPRQSGRYGMVLPRFVEAALDQRPLYVFGDGLQRRCFAHVDDVVTGLIRLLKCPDARGEVVNLGSTEEISIGDLAAKVIQLTESRSSIVRIPYEHAYDANFEDIQRRVPCLRKAERLVDYVPRKSIQDAVNDIVKTERAAIHATGGEKKEPIKQTMLP